MSLRVRGPLRVFGPALCVMTLAEAAVGQSVVIDQGSFEISINGRRAGTEDFAIRRSGVGPDRQTIATGEITITSPEGTVDLRSALQVVGGGMEISAYQMKVSGGRNEEVFLTRGDGRFLLRIRSDRGEQEREVRATRGTLLLDTNVAHQHYFLTQRLVVPGQPLPVVVPTEGGRHELTITESASEPVFVAGQSLQSRRLRLTVEERSWEVWVDEEGRVLRVADPDSGYGAIRTDLP